MNKVVAYARLLCIPGIGGLAIPPTIGIISVGFLDFYSLPILFTIGAFVALFGFIQYNRSYAIIIFAPHIGEKIFGSRMYKNDH